jgi:hypothetical protein
MTPSIAIKTPPKLQGARSFDALTVGSKVQSKKLLVVCTFTLAPSFSDSKSLEQIAWFIQLS